ncbi:VOC family protein [Nocardia sp. NPDC052316]|uniref:VOC family protein n=1 Tax=Nocardia sp. NPDC052316 TaxID=3364329 RepID=UPI0037C9F1EF
MAIDGIEGIFLSTHNWGRAAKFYKALGFELDFATDHGSGMLRRGDGPYLFLAEVPKNQEPQMQLILSVANADAFQPDASIDVVTPFEETHYGKKEMTVRDPDGRVLSIQAPLAG